MLCCAAQQNRPPIGGALRMTIGPKIPGAVIPRRVFTQPGSKRESAIFELMSAPTSCGNTPASGYVRGVPEPDSHPLTGRLSGTDHDGDLVLQTRACSP